MIAGKVCSARGSPLSGVAVSCNGHETATLADGTYRLEIPARSTYTITAMIKGFERGRREVIVGDAEEIQVDFCLRDAIGTGVIHGRVLDNVSGTPISSGGTVILVFPLANKYASISSDGCYEFRDLPADSYELWVSVPSYEEMRSIVTLAGGETRTLDIRCIPTRPVEPPWG